MQNLAKQRKIEQGPSARKSGPAPEHLIEGYKDVNPFAKLARVSAEYQFALGLSDTKIRAHLNYLTKLLETKLPAANFTKARIEYLENNRDLFNQRPVDLDAALSELDRKEDTKSLSEIALICIQTARLMKSRGLSLSNENKKFVRPFTNARSSVEMAFSETAGSGKSYTAVLNDEFELELSRMELAGDRLPFDRLPQGLSTKIVREAFKRANKTLRFTENSEIEAAAANEFSGNSFLSPIYRILHELCENALSHGIRSRINPNKHVPNVPFGNLLVMQLSHERIGRRDVGDASSYPPSFLEFHKKNQLGWGQKKRDYLVLSVFDNGMGIENHLKLFSNGDKKTFDLKDVLNGKHTSRFLGGTGEGLLRVQNIIKERNYFLSIRTPESGASISKQVRFVADTNFDQKSGTLFTLFIPR